MRKIYFILFALALIVASCSSLPSLVSATPTLAVIPTSLPTDTLPAPIIQPSEAQTMSPAPTDTLEASVTPSELTLFNTTLTPETTKGTLQATASLPTDTSMPTFASTSTQTFNATNTSTPLPQPTPQGPVFQSVTTSSDEIKWGDTCQTFPITFTAQTQTGFNVTEVLLFLRLQNQAGTITTYWDKAITMHSATLGTFTYDITPDKLDHYLDFNNAWVQYQLVAYNNQLHEVGRTQIYENSLLLTRCP